MFVSFKNRSMMVPSKTILARKIPRQLQQDGKIVLFFILLVASNALLKSIGPASVSMNSVVYANLAINVAT
jgi:hypothetical protein